MIGLKVKKAVVLFALIIALFSTSFSYIPAVHAQEVQPFSDVPRDHYAYAQIHRLRELGITSGIGNNKFGLGRTITRGEFVSFLVRLMGWDVVKPEKGSFLDNKDPNHYTYEMIETALAHGVIKKDSDYFRTNDPITREEMAVMIVRTLGCETLAQQLDSIERPFDDVTRNFGYIAIGKDLGIIAGIGQNKFAPNDTATREQAAAMMIRMYDKLNAPMEELHAFYAISSSNQADKLSRLDSVSFGWARVEYDKANGKVVINTERLKDGYYNNDYYIPQGFSEVVEKAKSYGSSCQLMFFINEEYVTDPATGKSVRLAEYIVTRPDIREEVIKSMAEMVNSTQKYGSTTSFDGVVSDFEGFKGETLRKAYNEFLSELKTELDKTGKKLYVAVHPRMKPGEDCFDGYDYRTIGEIADKVILMAHDYEAVSLTDEEMERGYTDTPVTPIDEVYYALKGITDRETGVRDLSKVWLQLSIDAVQWKLKDGAVTTKTPYHPTYDLLRNRFLSGADLYYSEYSGNPYARYYNTEDGTYNVIWYENQRSIAEKIKLARMFGIRGLSVWRLGLIPDYDNPSEASLELDIWGEIISNYR